MRGARGCFAYGFLFPVGKHGGAVAKVYLAYHRKNTNSAFLFALHEDGCLSDLVSSVGSQPHPSSTIFGMGSSLAFTHPVEEGGRKPFLATLPTVIGREGCRITHTSSIQFLITQRNKKPPTLFETPRRVDIEGGGMQMIIHFQFALLSFRFFSFWVEIILGWPWVVGTF
ncbi:hypothetical protein K440DRAFT_385609 [Wilcoxina mikolae CBS 423.85]|nr:hypothetical protein K440DRAFT_385609 [Wilcoxina mikolae CBS 423.85]